MDERKLQPSTVEQYKLNLALIQERIDGFIDPSKVPPDLVRSMISTQMTIEKESTNFSNKDNLELLDRLEKWYSDRNLEFPNKAYLERQRSRYQG